MRFIAIHTFDCFCISFSLTLFIHLQNNTLIYTNTPSNTPIHNIYNSDFILLKGSLNQLIIKYNLIKLFFINYTN